MAFSKGEHPCQPSLTLSQLEQRWTAIWPCCPDVHPLAVTQTAKEKPIWVAETPDFTHENHF